MPETGGYTKKSPFLYNRDIQVTIIIVRKGDLYGEESQ